MEVAFDKLDTSDLFVDCIYKGGPVSNMSSEPFHKLIPGCENAGGFRKSLGKMALGNTPILYFILLWKSLNGLIILMRKQVF